MHSYLIQLNNASVARFIAGTLILALVGSFLSYPQSTSADATSTAGGTEAYESDTATSSADGTDGDTSSTSESVVATGDTDADTDVLNESNTNTTDTDNETASSTDATSTDTEGGTSENTASTSPDTDSGTSTTATTTVTNTNSATTTTEATTTAETGGNNASGSTTTISTGDATASANVVNVANTNITNSNGLLGFFRYVFGLSELDIRDLFSVFETNEEDEQHATSTCDLSDCSDSEVSLKVTNENNAVISNDVVVRSETGNNTASGTDSYIKTGRAHAAANVVNVANTNIVDANYLMLTFSSFDDLLGDIVLPDDSVFESLFSQSTLGDTTNISNTNTATITNDITATADSGGNSATSASGTALVNTGEATAHSSVFNQVNTNVTGSDSFAMLFRVHGDWTGEVTGLPENMSVKQTPFGLELFNTGAHESSTAPTNEDLSVENNNTATIRNNVAVMAMSGGNTATGTTLSAIESGDAKASANVINITNSNILGRNWALLIFDIFGDWKGNLSFGRPDLWIGAAAQADNNPTTVDSDVDYTFTITNFSDTDATDVTLRTDFDTEKLSFSDETSTWDIGDIEAGETVEVTYPATVQSGIPEGTHPLTLKAAVSSRETDDDPSDNTDSVTIMAGDSRNTPDEKEEPGTFTFPSDLEVSKVASVGTTTPSSTVSYTITVENSGGRAFGSILYDTIFDEEGAVIVDQQWDLGTIYTDEEITVTYDVFFASSTEPGTYQNSAQVYAYDKSPSPNYGQNVESEIARVDVAVTETEGAVLGAATTTAQADTCGRYIQSYIQAGKQNDKIEVSKLQRFLRDTEGFTGVSISGVFDRATEEAVRKLQSKYKEDILTPWGLESATGNVYYTTRQKINELHCSGTAAFPLSNAQQHEIAQYRSVATPPLATHEETNEEDDTNLMTVAPQNTVITNRHHTTTQKTNESIAQPTRLAEMTETLFSWFKETFQLGLTVR